METGANCVFLDRGYGPDQPRNCTCGNMFFLCGFDDNLETALCRYRRDADALLILSRAAPAR